MLVIETIPVTPYEQNCRILFFAKSKEAVIIDPGGEVKKIFAFMDSRELKLNSIWLTHSHLDHCGGVQEVLDRYKCPLYGHKNEQFLRANVEKIASMYGLPREGLKNCPEPDVYISGGEKLAVSDSEEGKDNYWQTVFTPGHSEGHLCFYNQSLETLICGDTVFRGSIGRTDLPGGNLKTLLKSIKQNIFPLPDSTRLLSGHGFDTTLAAEKASNPYFRDIL
jgi:hydroxyacylglutathione hydrolase